MKKFLGLICLLYSGIILYVYTNNYLKNFLAPSMQRNLILIIIPLIIMGLVLIFNKKISYAFKISDAILLLPLVMIILAGNGNLTESLASNRSNNFNRNMATKAETTAEEETKEEQSVEEEIKNEVVQEKKEEYDFSNPYFDITDDIYDETANYISYGPKADKFNGKTIKVRGFSQKYASYIPDDFFTIGKYSISCCAADASFVGFFIKYDPDKVKNNTWYEVEGILKKGTDKDGYNIMYIDVINIKEMDDKEEQYIYPCYAYGDGNCSKVIEYDFEY